MPYIDPGWNTVDADIVAFTNDLKTAPPDDSVQRLSELVTLEETLLGLTEAAQRSRLEAEVQLKDRAVGFGGVDNGRIRGFYAIVGDQSLPTRVHWREGTQADALMIHGNVPAILAALRQTTKGQGTLNPKGSRA